MARVHSKAAAAAAGAGAGSPLPVCLLTCHTYNALVVNGTAREPRIGGATSQLRIVVLRANLQREDARRDVGILQRKQKHNQ